jgi:2,4-dienoyl-CoA reductase (NADPH2)
LAFSTIAAERGHAVTLFEADSEIGGQFNMAKRIPGKEEFYETLRFYQKQLELTNVNVQLNKRASADDLKDFDEVVLASGVSPRKAEIAGHDHPKVVSYYDVLKKNVPVGKRVAVIGAGGIGFDVSEFISQEGESPTMNKDLWLKEWGIDPTNSVRGGILGIQQHIVPPAREVVMFQRTAGKVGAKLGKTTGWIHRTTLKMKKVKMVDGVEYTKIDDAGLHYMDKTKTPQVYPCDTVIICAGQVSLKELQPSLQAMGKTVHVIGGADVAAELDAKRAINQAVRLAAVV